MATLVRLQSATARRDTDYSQCPETETKPAEPDGDYTSSPVVEDVFEDEPISAV